MKTLVELKDYDLTPVSTFSYHMDLVIQTIKHEFKKWSRLKCVHNFPDGPDLNSSATRRPEMSMLFYDFLLGNFRDDSWPNFDQIKFWVTAQRSTSGLKMRASVAPRLLSERRLLESHCSLHQTDSWRR